MPSPSSTVRRTRQSEAALQRQCDAWNARYGVGAKVGVIQDDGNVARTTTTTAAHVMHGIGACIGLRDIGVRLLDRVTPMLDLERCVPRAPACRFDALDLDEAADEWNCSCGPAALAAILGVPLHMARGLMPDFKGRGWTNAVMMAAAMDRSRTPWRRVARDGEWPRFGLARIQWGGPWLSPGVPQGARLTQTHWVAVAPQEDSDTERAVFDINAMHVGGWIAADSWSSRLVPELTREIDRADGSWSVSYGIEIEVTS